MHDKSTRVYEAHGAHSWTYANRVKLRDTPSVYLRITYTAMKSVDSDDVNQMYKLKNKGKKDKISHLLCLARATLVMNHPDSRERVRKKTTKTKTTWNYEKYNLWTYFEVISEFNEYNAI